MKLNWSFLINTALATTLLTLTVLPANAKKITNDVKDHSKASHPQVETLLAAGSSQNKHSTESKEKELKSKKTAEIELTIAILVIIGGLIFSEAYQRKQEQHRLAIGESKENKGVI